MPKLLLLLLALAPLALFGTPGPASAAPVLSGRAEIVDGDTLHLAGEKIRLHGIDAPEAAQDCADGTGRAYACGGEATAALARLTAAATTTCTGAERDRYGRLLAVCEAQGAEINGAMVGAGWALAYRRYADDYVAAEDAARSAGRGLWAGRFVEPWDWRRGRRLAAASGPAAPGDCRIKGNVSDSGRIYHVPGSAHYDRTRIDPARGERWFCSTAEARNAGWRAPRG